MHILGVGLGKCCSLGLEGADRCDSVYDQLGVQHVVYSIGSLEMLSSHHDLPSLQNMAETYEQKLPIAVIAKSGLQLATSIQTYVAAFEKDGPLAGVAVHIYNSASTLLQLQQIFEEEIPVCVFKDEGYERVKVLAAHCYQVYKVITYFVDKARDPTQEVKQDINVEDIIAFTPSSIAYSLKWSWLNPRIGRCKDLVEFLESSLLFVFQLGLLTNFQIRNPKRRPGTFEEEAVLRDLTLQLRSRSLRLAKEQAQLENKLCQKNLPLHDPLLSRSKIRTSLPGTNPDTKRFVAANVLGSASTRSVCTSSVNSINKETCISAPEGRLIIGNKKEMESVEKPSPDKSLAPMPETMIQRQPLITTNKTDWKVKTINLKENKHRVAYKNMFTALSSRILRLFRHSRGVAPDWGSEELEAYVVRDDTKEITKVSLGHKQLKDEVNRTLQHRGTQMLDWFASLSQINHMNMNLAIWAANQQDIRQRTLVGIRSRDGTLSDDLNGIVLFFSLGAPVEPVHLTDCLGREYDIPWASCPTWESIRIIITDAFRQVNVLGPRVRDGCYDLCSSKGGPIIPPRTFKAVVKPGSRIFMQMWRVPPRTVAPLPAPDTSRPVCNIPPKIRLKDHPTIIKDVERMGVHINFNDEIEMAKVSLGEALRRLTNATDQVVEFDYNEYDSDSDYDSGSSSSAGNSISNDDVEG